MTTRIIQWATGAVGLPQLRAVIDSCEYELVGLFVYSESKCGQDAGVLAGRSPVGVTATSDKAAILALDADLVLHAASKGFAQNSNTDDIVALLESGKSVITTTSYNHLATYGADAKARIEAACATTGARFHAAGEHPGFMFERLAVSLTALSQRVEKITVQELVDCSRIKEHAMLVTLMGMGKAPEEISPNSPMFKAVSVQYQQSLAAAAEVLGLTIDEIQSDIRVGVVDHDVEVACGTLPAGSVVGQVLSWTAICDGKPRLVAEEYWTSADDIPNWGFKLDGRFLVRAIVEGTPDMKLELVIENGAYEGSSGGHVAVAMTAVRAIPYVLKAPSGVVVPEIFGAYRWPVASDGQSGN
jgi:2,4-diaminopentanoate dehydrogenase